MPLVQEGDFASEVPGERRVGYDRRQLLRSFDSLRRDHDGSGTVAAVDAATERALGVLTSSKLLDALDLSDEVRHALLGGNARSVFTRLSGPEPHHRLTPEDQS